MNNKLTLALALVVSLAATAAQAQPCPDKNLNYWQAFPPGGESDIAARRTMDKTPGACS